MLHKTIRSDQADIGVGTIKEFGMAEIKWLKDNEYPTQQGDWVLITREGPVWSINSATSTGDNVPSVPIGSFHLLNDILACTIKWADRTGIDWIYIRPADDFAHF